MARSDCGDSGVETNDPFGRDDDYITLKLVAQDDNGQLFRIKRTQQLGKLFQSFAQMRGLSFQYGALRWLFDGSRVWDAATPQELGLQDNDVLEMYLEQSGGARDN